MNHQVGRLYVLVGLPGSGKSTLLNDGFQQDHPDVLIFDDYQANAIADQPDPQWSRNRSAVIAALRRGRSVLVCDISYCRPEALARLLDLMQEDVPGIEVETIFFENDPAAAAHNVRLRDRDQADLEVALIKELSTIYQPPADAIPITTGVQRSDAVN